MTDDTPKQQTRCGATPGPSTQPTAQPSHATGRGGIASTVMSGIEGVMGGILGHPMFAHVSSPNRCHNDRCIEYWDMYRKCVDAATDWNIEKCNDHRKQFDKCMALHERS